MLKQHYLHCKKDCSRILRHDIFGNIAKDIRTQINWVQKNRSCIIVLNIKNWCLKYHANNIVVLLR
jgi:hypothetical protein